jgi:cation:H+ antiporter
MLPVTLQFVVCALVIVISGTALTRFADAIAELTGLGRLLVGMLFLAAATSLPELAVDISAVRLGHADLAIGDLYGSSLMNLLILGVLDLFHRSRGRMLSPASGAHALSGAMSISLTALAGLAVIIGPRTQNLSVLGVNFVAWAILAVFLMGLRVVYYDQKWTLQQIPQASPPVDSEEKSERRMKLWQATLGYVVSAAVILIVGPLLARAAARLAELSGLGNTFVGTTFVALCTSLPELATSIAALRLGAFDLVIGNIIGSNSFNMILLVPLDLAHPGSLVAAVSPTHVVTCLATIIVTSVVIAGQLYHAERRIRIVEPDAVLVVMLVSASLAMIYFLR